MPLYSPEFASDPHRAYHEMRRQYGSLVPVEPAPGVPATLVVGHNAAVRILNDPEHFPADPRTWQKDIPTDCPVLPIMEWRPTASRNSGSEFLRYRQAIAASIGEVDLRQHACPAQTLAYLIAQDAIDQLLDVLPEMRSAVSADALTWRPGPFHRALAALPVTFPPSVPLNL